MAGITIDKSLAIPVYSQQCTFCKHELPAELRKCAAFPDGIPLKIWNFELRHDKPIEGQGNNIVFEEVK